MKPTTTCLITLLCISLLDLAAATELTRLTPATWDEYAPAGKEVDCIYGDYVLRNDKLVAVIAEPLATRNANMTVRNNGAMIIDLTRRDRPNDQLSTYHPNGMQASFHSPDRVAIKVDGKAASVGNDEVLQGRDVQWECSTTVASGLEITVQYTLEQGADALRASTIIRNPTPEAIEFAASDYIRADRTFEFGNDPATGLFWAHDDWFAQAYGVIVDGCSLKAGGSRGSVLAIERDGNDKVSLAAGESTTISRSIFPGGSLLEVRGIATRLAGVKTQANTIRISDSDGPVVHAKVTVSLAGAKYGSARTDEKGEVHVAIPQDAGTFAYEIDAAGGRQISGMREALAEDEVLSFNIEPQGYVVANITDESGEPIPCKVAFHGVDETPTPDFGPDSGAVAIKNLHYSHNGKFRQPIGPGKYEVIISFGPEYDAVFRTIEVKRGETTELSAKLKRVVDTTGWVSSDFHSHSTPSGDNTSMQVGRVLNLLCENVEFCPCTEHNRISSYIPHLQQLGVEHWMATCSGMELTGSLLPVNHQNAFPLKYTPRTQDGGAPVTDTNPIAQIERLAFWDNKSDKLVQENHPNLYQIIGDRDLNDEPDGGFEAMFGFMDVIEVHPLETIFTKPEKDEKGRLSRNPIYHWMQMLNLGYRIPGVVNTDAHYNFHESGWLRNYLKSSTDTIAKIDTMEMVHTSEAGHITMTTGPFMEVTMRPRARSITPVGIPGDDVIAPGGKAALSVRVQCPNWLDINRVQVFVNGRPQNDLNFTRRDTPQPFSDGVVKFESDIPLELAQDAHIIVAAVGEGITLGRVMGPLLGGAKPPITVSNPIFVDVDGDGFKANGDLLDVPLPLSSM
ncbi:MAG: CehA/McbA family metallohydrolase [Planctomycetaceae bacterium]|nr:CehA/McbA family metallohydrolase [Planctomycetales bacterium]MCB9920551.1 CehA/McbA family metallohydrolase [Planctomycetaceae bacterium]